MKPLEFGRDLIITAGEAAMGEEGLRAREGLRAESESDMREREKKVQKMQRKSLFKSTGKEQRRNKPERLSFFLKTMS